MGQEEPKGVGSGTVPCSHGVVGPYFFPLACLALMVTGSDQSGPMLSDSGGAAARAGEAGMVEVGWP